MRRGERTWWWCLSPAKARWGRRAAAAAAQSSPREREHAWGSGAGLQDRTMPVPQAKPRLGPVLELEQSWTRVCLDFCH
jgi:hypothetical protein